MAILANKLNTGVVTLDVANATYVVAGNNSVSNLTVNSTSTEILSGCTIKRVAWGTDAAGSWQIKRGANVVFVVNNSGDLNFADGFAPLSLYPAANVTVTLFGTANGFITMYLQKRGTFVNPADIT